MGVKVMPGTPCLCYNQFQIDHLLLTFQPCQPEENLFMLTWREVLGHV